MTDSKTDAKLEYDDDQCRENYDKFTAFCEKILTYNSGLKTSPNPIVVKMNKFKKIWDLMEPSDRCEIIETQLYKDYKQQLLKAGDKYDWISTSGITISLPGKGNKDRCVMCSSVYSKCVALKDAAEKDIEGLPDSAAESREELNFPDIFLLYYYRLIKCVVFSNVGEREKIKSKIDGFESDLGIKNGDSVDIKSNPLPGLGNLLGQNGVPNLNNIGANLGNIFNNIGPALGNLIKNGPDGIQLNPDGAKGLLGKLTENNPGLGKQIGENFGSILEQKTPGEMLTAALDKLNSPETRQAINKMLPISDKEIESKMTSSDLPALLPITSGNPAEQE
jgi:hypothetical protein